MASALGSPGKAKIYNTDGTGRDTYVSHNNGGFTAMKLPHLTNQRGPGNMGYLRTKQ